MRLVLHIAAIAALLSPALAQRVLLVDASGQTGQYRSIQKAVLASNKHDLILVRKGTYTENVLIDNRSVAILGIEPNPKDVVLRMPFGTTPALTIRNHPAGETSRFARFTIQTSTSYPYGIHTRSTKGTLLFDMIDVKGHCNSIDHDGILSFSSCSFQAASTVLYVQSAKTLLCHDCWFATSWVNNYLVILAGATIVDSSGHLSRCRGNGPAGGTYYPPGFNYPGGPALKILRSYVTVSGLAADTFVGGNGVLSSTTKRTTVGGPAILVEQGTLQLTGMTLQGGLGQYQGGPLKRSPPIELKGFGANVKRPDPPLPVLTTKTSSQPLKLFSRGARTDVTVQATPHATSMTFVAIDIARSTTPWGWSLIDLTKPSIVHLLGHDANGQANFALDLRGLPATFVGLPYVLQTAAVDTKNRVSLSGARLGVIGF